MDTEKALALLTFANNINPSHHTEQDEETFAELLEDVTELSENCFQLDGAEYVVLTDEEADEAAKDFILKFFDECVGYQFYNSPDKQEKERNKRLWEEHVKQFHDTEKYFQWVIDSDGRGNSLATYDGDENEAEYNGVTYYIYRTN